MNDIRQSTGSSPASTKLPPSPNLLHSFCLYSSDEIRKLIVASKTKSCALYPIPTGVLKEFLDELLPIITHKCNQSLLEGQLPLSQRHATITPIVKKPGLDCKDVKNYRPISNLTYMSKFVERLVCKQVTSFLEENNLLPRHQSGFRARHSTETAVLKVMSDIMAAADDGRVTLLRLLDMSAAFDTVDHHILLQRLKSSVGLTNCSFAVGVIFYRQNTTCHFQRFDLHRRCVIIWCASRKRPRSTLIPGILRFCARLVMRKRKFDPISEDIRNTLHWLPVRQRIEFKLGIVAFKCLHGDAPPYLTESLSLQAHRSATRSDLVVPRTQTVKMGPQSFCVSGPMLWNSLPLEIRNHEQTLESFKAKLKTYLFKKAYFS